MEIRKQGAIGTDLQVIFKGRTDRNKSGYHTKVFWFAEKEGISAAPVPEMGKLQYACRFREDIGGIGMKTLESRLSALRKMADRSV